MYTWSNGIKCLKSAKNERYPCSIWSIPRMSEKFNLFQSSYTLHVAKGQPVENKIHFNLKMGFNMKLFRSELSSSDFNLPSNKPIRLHNFFWATLYWRLLINLNLSEKWEFVYSNHTSYGQGKPVIPVNPIVSSDSSCSMMQLVKNKIEFMNDELIHNEFNGWLCKSAMMIKVILWFDKKYFLAFEIESISAFFLPKFSS